MRRIRIMSVFGTRPEAIKMCPLVLAMEQEARLESLVCVTGQHREMLHQAMAQFSVTAQDDLDVMQARQTLAQMTGRVLNGMEEVLARRRPEMVLVHGDTTTSFAAALAAFYARIPVGHVEAGLRTPTFDSPFPEEMNRRLTGRIARLHFAPTARAAENLAREGVREGVYVTGNTVIDALGYTVREGYRFCAPALADGLPPGRLVLVTAHRRENWGRPMENICRAVRALADRFGDVRFLFPMHLNPTVRKTVQGLLSGHPRILLTDPLDAVDMHNLLARSYLVLTDSGGLQEEAPALGAPVVVLRTETERPEAIEAGTAVLAGVEQADIERVAGRLLSDAAAHAAMAHAVSPYGDGHASERILEAVLQYFDKA